MTNRRKFLKNGLALVTLAGASHLSFRVISPFASTIVSIIKEDLFFLQIQPNDIEQFANDLEKTNALGFGLPQTTILKLYNTSYLKHLPLPFSSKYKAYKNDIVGRFLLSTDFFLNKMDESKAVKYMGKVWGPYSTPCMHPFSSIYYQTKTP